MRVYLYAGLCLLSILRPYYSNSRVAEHRFSVLFALVSSALRTALDMEKGCHKYLLNVKEPNSVGDSQTRKILYQNKITDDTNFLLI